MFNDHSPGVRVSLSVHAIRAVPMGTAVGFADFESGHIVPLIQDDDRGWLVLSYADVRISGQRPKSVV